MDTIEEARMAVRPVENLYNKIWREQAGTAPYAGGNLRVDLTNRVVEPGRRLLDLGCGDGVLGELLKDRFDEVIGVDISDQALIVAKQRGLATYRVNLDEEALPFPDATFDAITCLDLIEHVFEPRVLVSEIARVLAPGGSLYIAFPNMRYALRIKEIIAGRFPKTSGDIAYSYDGGHLHYYTPGDVRLLLQERGLITVSERGIVSGGIRKNWKYRLLNALLPANLRREFLSIEVLLRAVRPKQT
jgi:methionine biosynthesis protein MetW